MSSVHKHLSHRSVLCKVVIAVGEEREILHCRDIQESDGRRRALTAEEKQGQISLPHGSRIYRLDNIQSQGAANEDTPCGHLCDQAARRRTRRASEDVDSLIVAVDRVDLQLGSPPACHTQDLQVVVARAGPGLWFLSGARTPFRHPLLVRDRLRAA